MVDRGDAAERDLAEEQTLRDGHTAAAHKLEAAQQLVPLGPRTPNTQAACSTLVSFEAFLVAMDKLTARGSRLRGAVRVLHIDVSQRGNKAKTLRLVWHARGCGVRDHALPECGQSGPVRW